MMNFDTTDNNIVVLEHADAVVTGRVLLSSNNSNNGNEENNACNVLEIKPSSNNTMTSSSSSLFATSTTNSLRATAPVYYLPTQLRNSSSFNEKLISPAMTNNRFKYNLPSPSSSSLLLNKNEVCPFQFNFIVPDGCGVFSNSPAITFEPMVGVGQAQALVGPNRRRDIFQFCTPSAKKVPSLLSDEDSNMKMDEENDVSKKRSAPPKFCPNDFFNDFMKMTTNCLEQMNLNSKECQLILNNKKKEDVTFQLGVGDRRRFRHRNSTTTTTPPMLRRRAAAVFSSFF